MKRLILCCICGVLLAGCSDQESAKPEKLSVPLLSGGEISIPRREADKISPIGWAMLLERDGDKPETRAAFREACRKKPDLLSKVNELYAIKGKIECAERKHRHRVIRR